MSETTVETSASISSSLFYLAASQVDVFTGPIPQTWQTATKSG